MANAKTIRWVAALVGVALLAALGYAVLRLRGAPGTEIRRAEDTGETGETGPRIGFSVSGDSDELEQTLAEQAAIAEDTPEGQLVLAARNGDLERMRELLGEGVPAEAEESRHGHRPLHQAARANRLAAVELLLEAGAALDGRDGEGETPLMKAAVGAATDTGRRLLDAGAAVDARSDPAGETALSALANGAAMRRLGGGDAVSPSIADAELEFARMLFERGADPNLHGEESPVKVLLVTQNEALLALFVEHGAGVTADPDLAMLATLMPGRLGELLQEALANASPNPGEAPPPEPPDDR